MADLISYRDFAKDVLTTYIEFSPKAYAVMSPAIKAPSPSTHLLTGCGTRGRCENLTIS